RDRPPGGQAHGDVVQYRHAVPVGEGHAVDLDLQRASGQVLAVGRLGDVHGRGQHAQHLAPAGQGDLGLVEDLGQLGDGVEQQVDEEDEGDHLADAQAPTGPPGGPDRDDAGQGAGPEQVAQGEHGGDVAGGGQVGPVLAVDGCPQPGPGPLLEAVGLDD